MRLWHGHETRVTCQPRPPPLTGLAEPSGIQGGRRRDACCGPCGGRAPSACRRSGRAASRSAGAADRLPRRCRRVARSSRTDAAPRWRRSSPPSARSGYREVARSRARKAIAGGAPIMAAPRRWCRWWPAASDPCRMGGQMKRQDREQFAENRAEQQRGEEQAAAKAAANRDRRNPRLRQQEEKRAAGRDSRERHDAGHADLPMSDAARSRASAPTASPP